MGTQRLTTIINVPWNANEYYYGVYMSPGVRKSTFCIFESKDADQLHGNREADQRLCFHYLNSTIALISKAKISSL